jgi:hypothetical protein
MANGNDFVARARLGASMRRGQGLVRCQLP